MGLSNYATFSKVIRAAMLFSLICLFTNITPALSAVPSIESGLGVTSYYKVATGDQLLFNITVKDSDGISPDSHKVTVIYPDRVTTKTLEFAKEHNMATGTFDTALFQLMFTTESFIDGEYIFEVEDDTETVTRADAFYSNPLHSVPATSVPEYYTDPEDSLRVKLRYSLIPEASWYYLKIAMRYGTELMQFKTVYSVWRPSSDDPFVDFPIEYFAPGCEYFYYVTAYREPPALQGFYASNASQSTGEYFTTPGTGYVAEILWFGTRHRTHEDNYRPNYNTLDFTLKTISDDFISQDIVKTVKLFDPNHKQVNISAFTFYNNSYQWRYAKYKQNRDVWDYNDSEIHETSYSGIIYEELIDGEYTLEVTDAYDNILSKTDVTFVELEQGLPIVPLNSTFDFHRDIWNNLHFSWEIPDVVFPEGSYFKSKLLCREYEIGPGGTTDKVYKEILMTSPPFLSNAFIPSHIAETILTDMSVDKLQLILDVNTTGYKARSDWQILGSPQEVFEDGVIPEEDKDGDGICNKVDVFDGYRIDDTRSNDFSDGSTTGTITFRGDPELTFDIKDEEYPNGVTIATIGPGEGTVEACGGSTSLTLNDGDTVLLTCGSTTNDVQVIFGEVDITFEADDGTTVVMTLVEYYGISFDAANTTISAPSSNLSPIIVYIDGQPVEIYPSEDKQIVSLDVLPNDEDKCIKQNDHGVIPVTIYGSNVLDVHQIVVESLSLQGLRVKLKGKSGKYHAVYKDSNGDGFVDLVTKFEDSDEWLETGNDYVIIAGELIDGTSIEAYDTVCITD